MNRRDFITALGASAATVAFARPVRSLVGEKGASLAEAAKSVPSASLYIQEGLVGMWDGVENIGFGQHSAGTSVWKDLIGSNDIIVPTGDHFEPDHLAHSSGTPQSAETTRLLEGTNFTVESVFSITSGKTFRSVNTLSGNSGFCQYTLNSAATGNRTCARMSRGDGSNMSYTEYDRKNFEIPLFEKVSLSHIWIFGTSYRSYINGELEFANVNRVQPVGYTQTTTLKVFYEQPCSGYCLRLYDRALTAEEVAYNHQLDVERFAL